MRITKTNTSLLSNVFQSLMIKTTTNQNKMATVATNISLKSKTVNTGYDQKGNDIIYNTATNQKLSNFNSQVQDSTDPSKKYTGSLTPSQLGEKFANGDELSNDEYYFMLKELDGNIFDAAFHKRNAVLEEKKISTVLTKNNIQLSSDQELRISVDCQNKITVSGIDDPEKCQQIANDLSSEASTLASLFQHNSETYTKVSGNFAGTAQALGRIANYLNEKTNGKIAITDLTVEDGKIVGLTPELDRLLNRNITPEDCLKFDERENDTMKYGIIGAITYISINGAEDLPQMSFTLSYKNGKLSCIEQPDLIASHPETRTREQYIDQANLIQQDPMAYFNNLLKQQIKGQW
jgi:hypothetical protein